MRIPRRPPTRLVRPALFATWIGSAWGDPRVCFAASCPVEFRGAPSEPWLRAGRTLEALTTDPSDCGRIAIEFERSTGVARLIFVTLDGRRAERRLTHPDDLMPTVVALGVRGTGEISTPVLENGPVALARNTDTASPSASPPSEAASLPGEGRVLFALLGGTRAGAGGLVSPVLSGVAAIALERWELGVNLALELQYFDLHLPEPDGPSAAASAGVTVGRREPIADFEVLFGARAMVAAVNDESQVDSGERGRAEIRLGAYLSGVWPRQRSSRFRADLALEVVPHESLGAIGAPVTPGVAVSALMGLEFGEP